MISRLILASLAFLYLLVSVTSNYHWVFQNENNPVQLCGPMLSEVVAIICNLNYAKKKNVPVSEYDDEDNNVLRLPNYNAIDKDVDISQRNYQPKWPYPVKSRMNAYSLIPRRRRRQIGIVEECCDKPCSLNELRSYCAVG